MVKDKENEGWTLVMIYMDLRLLWGQYLAWGVSFWGSRRVQSSLPASSYYGMMGLIVIRVSYVDGVIACGGKITTTNLPLVHRF